MTLRRTLSALFASALMASFATAAMAAPAKPHVVHKPMVHHAAPKPMHTARRAGMHAPMHAPMRARGGDAQNATVDQLNAQSLQRATTGAPAQ